MSGSVGKITDPDQEHNWVQENIFHNSSIYAILGTMQK